MTKLVSVIITTYKRNDTLKRAIDSVLSQTYKNIEIIVVDDNNEDSVYRELTKQAMEKYVGLDNFKYIKHKNNMNGAFARNTGILNSSGDFITFLDDDDYFFSDRIEKLVKLLENASSEYGIIFSGYQYIKNEKILKKDFPILKKDPLFSMLSCDFHIGSGSNFLLKKEVIKKVGNFDTSFMRNQDIEFLIRVFNEFKILVTEEVLLNIQLDDGNQNKITVDKVIKTKQKLLDKYNDIIELYDKEYIKYRQLQRVLYLITFNNQIMDYKSFIINYFKKIKKVYYFSSIMFLIKGMLANLRNKL
ncbi:glycosyltransferase family 2 protein [Globicatella sanguinis]